MLKIQVLLNKKYTALFGMIIYGLFCYTISTCIYQNVTKSEPLGYYFAYSKKSYDINDLVLFCVDNRMYIDIIQKLGIHKNGNCPNNMPYLIKKIVATSGDIIKINTFGIWVNDKLLLNSEAISIHNGIKLSPQPLQIFRLKHGEYFMLGATNSSYDSRYFGVVKAKQIVKKAIFIF